MTRLTTSKLRRNFLILLLCQLLSTSPDSLGASIDKLRFDASGETVTITSSDVFASGDLSIPSTIDGKPVTSIADGAFQGRHFLTSVTIPETVSSIGNNAFSSCTSLKKVHIGEAVTTIGNAAFSSCDSLTSITIPPSVTSIGRSAFLGNDSLLKILVAPENPAFSHIEGQLYDKSHKTLIAYPAGRIGFFLIPAGVTTIADEAFSFCGSLSHVSIPDSVNSIGANAFSFCSKLSSVSIPDSVTFMGERAFQHCDSLVTISLSNRLTTIEDFTFSFCTALKSISLPDAITSIGNHAFFNCTELRQIRIPSSVTTIKNSAFFECDSLSSITLPDSLISIGERAFFSCDTLARISVGSNVRYVGTWAFSFCRSLKDIVFRGDVPTINQSFLNVHSDATVIVPADAASFGPTFGGLPVVIQPPVPPSIKKAWFDADGNFVVKLDRPPTMFRLMHTPNIQSKFTEVVTTEPQGDDEILIKSTAIELQTNQGFFRMSNR